MGPGPVGNRGEERSAGPWWIEEDTGALASSACGGDGEGVQCYLDLEVGGFRDCQSRRPPPPLPPRLRLGSRELSFIRCTAILPALAKPRVFLNLKGLKAGRVP